MKKIILAILLVAFIFGLSACYGLHTAVNVIDYKHHKIDEITDYTTIKRVEDTCRSMISSYESDKLMYEQYRDSDNEDKQDWAEQAKIRANRTASTYNNYILENSFVWQHNVPNDISEKLEYLN